ncbi:hypothetical protein AcW1_001952 [Taiwanofungus camphoratus]|nr:hypothetical protein AcV5_009945 [Antrodia cinnamomea]KAI0944189.1 hypothetical protein AcW1_001952 [Antrodia cinnamomea]
MSSTSASIPSSTTTSAPPSSSSQPSQSQNGTPTLTSSASLYLYTFLATLVLLLSVSAAIVVRSYLIRRRQRRQLEEAIRDGTYIPPPQLSRQRKFGEKPSLHDVYLMSDREKGRDHLRSGEGSKNEWNTIMPVAATVMKATAASSETKPTPQPTPQSTTLMAWLRPLRRQTQPSAETAIPLSSMAQQQSSTDFLSPQPSSSVPLMSSQTESLTGVALSEAEQVRLTVLIAMPTRHREHHNDDEVQLPHIDFGIAQVPFRADGRGGVAEGGSRTV